MFKGSEKSDPFIITHLFDVGVKRYFDPNMIPDCYVLRTLAILQTFVIRSFFFEKWLLTHVCAGPKVKTSLASELASKF
jgi:hypothetical protein